MIGRLIYLVVLLASALLLGLGMYFQYALHLHPCGPQVLVRYALVLAALFALFVVAIHSGKLVRIVISACIGLVSLVGVVMAAHQSWPHHVPLDFAKVGVNIDRRSRSSPGQRHAEILSGLRQLRQGALEHPRGCRFGVGFRRVPAIHPGCIRGGAPRLTTELSLWNDQRPSSPGRFPDLLATRCMISRWPECSHNLIC